MQAWLRIAIGRTVKVSLNLRYSTSFLSESALKLSFERTKSKSRVSTYSTTWAFGQVKGMKKIVILWNQVKLNIMLRKIRVAIAAISITVATLLFLEFTGTLRAWFSWIAKIQFIPAILATSLITILALLILTLLFGRIYCSIICPLGIAQDIFSAAGGKIKKNRFDYKKPLNWLRYIILLAFAVILFLGLTQIAAWIEPYSTFGRIFTSLTGIAIFAAIMLLALWKGRLWCSVICPVGTFLGLISKHCLFKPGIDTTKCTGCGLCAKNCKCSCIDPATHKIDTSRCVVCLDCLNICNTNAIVFKSSCSKPSANASKCETQPDESKRAFIAATALAASAATIKAQTIKFDGGLAAIEDKKEPNREVPLKPAGARSLKHFTRSCVACQLCVTKCPEKVLHPSTNLETFMQPEMSFAEGYCRYKCTICSQVCPSKAIEPISVEEKSSIKIGHAVWISDNCVVNRDGVQCGNCADHCPTKAITMLPEDAQKEQRTPSINNELCIGCGSCEYHCPSRPYSAIYIVGHEVHSER